MTSPLSWAGKELAGPQNPLSLSNIPYTKDGLDRDEHLCIVSPNGSWGNPVTSYTNGD